LSSTTMLDGKAAELRSAFDRERIAPFFSGSDELENFLAIRVSKDAYALRVSEISSLIADKKIVELPTSVPELLGLAGVRGTLIPVYDLAALLGYSKEKDELRWLAVCGTEDSIGLAFHEFEGYLRIPRASVCAVEPNEAERTRLTHMVRGLEVARVVVSIPLLKATIQERCQGSVRKER
jgi:chemotaxis signal transduction protein